LLYAQNQGQGVIYLTGGFRGTQVSPTYSHGLYRYTPGSAHWDTINVANFPVMGNNAAALDQQGNLYFTGGYSPDLGTIVQVLHMYQPSDNTLHTLYVPAQLTLGFGNSMLADHEGHLYLSEGFTTPGNPNTQAGTGWYRYDLSTGEWHNLPNLPVGLGYVQMAQDANGNILLLGGSLDAGQNQPNLHIYRYNVQQSTWTQVIGTLPNPLSGSAGCSDGQGHLIIIGGFDAAHNQSLATTWQLNLQTLHWQALTPLPTGGSELGSAACDGTGHVYLTRGANNPAKPTADFLELTLPK
jgi:N-acetylneuraminic acid mutarotase